MSACLCGRCVPNDIPKDPWRTACARCGQEVRFGVRDEQKGWWHREIVDHVAVLGHSPPQKKPEPEPPTEEEIAYEALQNAEVEVWAHPVDVTEFSAQSGIRQMFNLVTGKTKAGKGKSAPPAAPGWECINLHHARGPYKGSKGEVLSISDTHVLRARGPVELDGSYRVAVASWRDMAFDFAFVGSVANGRLDVRKVDSTTMKNWIKGIEA